MKSLILTFGYRTIKVVVAPFASAELFISSNPFLWLRIIDDFEFQEEILCCIVWEWVVLLIFLEQFVKFFILIEVNT